MLDNDEVGKRTRDASDCHSSSDVGEGTAVR